MKSGRLFFGCFLVSIGLLLLLQNLGVLPAFSLWRLLGHLWPVLLILAGISLVLNSSGAVVLLLVLAALLLGGGFLLFGPLDWAFEGHLEPRVKESQPGVETLAIPWGEELKRLEVEVELAAGRLELGSGTDLVAEGKLPYLVDPPQVKYWERRGEGQLNLKLGDLGQPQLGWQVRLTDRVPLELKVRGGAGVARLDLGELQVDRLEVETGASDLWVRLGARRPRTEVEIDAGASQVTLVVPACAGVKIQVESPLSRVTMPAYTRMGDIYLSPNFEEAAAILEIKIDAAVSSLEVREEQIEEDLGVEGQSL